WHVVIFPANEEIAVLSYRRHIGNGRAAGGKHRRNADNGPQCPVRSAHDVLPRFIAFFGLETTTARGGSISPFPPSLRHVRLPSETHRESGHSGSAAWGPARSSRLFRIRAVAPHTSHPRDRVLSDPRVFCQH